jgi:hypothetical protein
VWPVCRWGASSVGHALGLASQVVEDGRVAYHRPDEQHSKLMLCVPRLDSPIMPACHVSEQLCE